MIEAAIDFSHTILREDARFAGRRWVLDRIRRWIDQRNTESRFFVITGPPGCGKTAISAHLAALSAGIASSYADSPFSPGFLTAAHFCSSKEALWNSPFFFAHSLSKQIANHYPQFEAALREILSRRVSINIQQNVTGNAIGIGSFSLGEQSPQQAFLELCRVPLEKLAYDAPEARILLLVDAIDESLTFSGDVSIFDLLAQSDELPPSVRFILTTRPKSKIEMAFGGADLDLSSPQFAGLNRSDLKQYVERECATKQGLLSVSGEQRGELAAQGNFLYVAFALKFIEAAGGMPPSDLPKDLPQLMTRWLEQLLSVSGRDWANDYAPILGALTVAQESVEEPWLQRMVRQPTRHFSENLSDLREFMDVRHGKFSLYHESFREFLQAESFSLKTSVIQNRFRLPELGEHKSVVRAYRPKDEPWAELELDDYGIRHLARHLACLAKEPGYERALYDFLSPKLLALKRAQNRDDASFAQDLSAAARIARERDPPDVAEWIRSSFIRACLQAPLARIPSAAVGALALAGKLDLAASIASLRANGYDYVYIAEAAASHANKRAADDAIAILWRSFNTYDLPLQIRVLELMYSRGLVAESRDLVRQLLATKRFMGAINQDVFQALARFCIAIGDLKEIDSAIASTRDDPVFVGEFGAFMQRKIEALHCLDLARAWLAAGDNNKAVGCVDAALRLEMSTGIVLNDIRMPAALLLEQAGDAVRAQKLTAPLKKEDRGELRGLRTLEFGDLDKVVREAKLQGDDKVLKSAVEYAIKRGQLDLAIDELAAQEKQPGSDSLLRHLAVAGAEQSKSDALVLAFRKMTGIGVPEDFWYRLAKSLSQAASSEFVTVIARLDPAQDLESMGEEVTGLIAFAEASRGLLAEALCRVEQLIADARNKERRAAVFRTIFQIATCLSSVEQCLEIAEAVVRSSDPNWLAEYGITADQIPEAALNEMRKFVAKEKAAKEEIENFVRSRGPGEIGERLNSMCERLPQGERQDSPLSPEAPPDLKEKFARGSDLEKSQLLTDYGAELVDQVGISAVLNTVLHSHMKLLLLGTLQNVARQLAATVPTNRALAFIAAHLEEATLVGGSDGLFQISDDYVPLLHDLGLDDILFRACEGLIDFGLRC